MVKLSIPYLLNNTWLSDLTKAYLSSYSSGPRPELSDYTKAYLNSVSSSTSTSRPELSNLTKAYLSGNPGFGDSENKDEVKEENKES